MAETKKDALLAFDAFIETWCVKYDRATECLIKDLLRPALPEQVGGELGRVAQRGDRLLHELEPLDLVQVGAAGWPRENHTEATRGRYHALIAWAVSYVHVKSGCSSDNSRQRDEAALTLRAITGLMHCSK